MKATWPEIRVPGDGPDPTGVNNVMWRSGDCMGMTRHDAVWRFGFIHNSPAAIAYGVSLPEDYKGYLWVLAIRKTGKIKDFWSGYAKDLPDDFRMVMDWEPT
jgi:hypothetical protein